MTWRINSGNSVDSDTWIRMDSAFVSRPLPSLADVSLH